MNGSPTSRPGEAQSWRRGELARLAGCHPETVRFYEKAGLLPPVPRSPSGHRRYGPAHLARLRFILAGRRLGFSLDEVRELLRLAEGGGSCDEVRGLAERHLAAVEQRLGELQALRARLVRLVDDCRAGKGPDCAVLVGLFAQMADGEGSDLSSQRLGGSDLR